jgi:hypothetical protein
MVRGSLWEGFQGCRAAAGKPGAGQLEPDLLGNRAAPSVYGISGEPTPGFATLALLGPHPLLHPGFSPGPARQEEFP